MPRQERINGPYKHRTRWRVLLSRGDGTTIVESFASREAAAAFIAAARQQAEGRTVSMAVEAWLAAMAERGCRPSHVERSRYSLAQLLDLDANGARLLEWVAPRGQRLYDACRERGYSTTTQIGALAAGRSFGRWCVKRGWLRADPWATVESVGRKARGSDKAALRIDEANRLAAVCIEERSPSAVAVLCALLFGARATEITARVVRDLDDKGRVLWIDSAVKTSSSRRHLDVPDVLRPMLAELVAGLDGRDPIFRREDGKPATRHWLHHHCDRLCRAARVPEVGPHGLRRTQSRIATAAGATPGLVAAALGHASPAITARAYVDPSTARAAQARAALTVLRGGRG